MEIEFDPAKERRNLALRGISLSFAAKILKARIADEIDGRRDYGEERRIACGFIDERLYVCVYTRRRQVYRIISVRKANQRERARYDRPSPQD
jgi:hypothetical protein